MIWARSPEHELLALELAELDLGRAISNFRNSVMWMAIDCIAVCRRGETNCCFVLPDAIA
jgi:hypothetical protein